MEVIGFFNNVAPSLMNLPGISSKPVLFETFIPHSSLYTKSSDIVFKFKVLIYTFLSI